MPRTPKLRELRESAAISVSSTGETRDPKNQMLQRKTGAARVEN